MSFVNVKVFGTADFPEELWESLNCERVLFAEDDLAIWCVGGFVSEYEEAAENDKPKYCKKSLANCRVIDSWFVEHGAMRGEIVLLEKGYVTLGVRKT